jgi:chorismate dehydratase
VTGGGTATYNWVVTKAEQVDGGLHVRGLHLAAVSYLNSKPILYGLGERAGVRLSLDVPSRLVGYMDGSRQPGADAALLPVIDYLRLEDVALLPVSGIGCDGPTLTVRIFSDRPVGQIETLAVDGDSHTSVVLAQVVMSKLFGRKVGVVRLTAETVGPRLLIGDKVITAAPTGMEHQLDLGEAWKRLTGRPCLFAGWFVKLGADVERVRAVLAEAADAGLARREEIVQEYAPKMGWPVDVARKYVFEYLRYGVGDAQVAAVREFYRLAAEVGAVEAGRELRVI